MGGPAGPTAGADRAELSRLLREADQALDRAGDLRRARRCNLAALRLADRLGDGAALATAATGLSGLWVHEHRTAETAAITEAWQRRALAAVPPDSLPALRLRARLAAEEDYRTGGHSLVAEVLAQARRRDDPAALAQALSLAHHCLLGAGLGAQRAELARQLLLAAARTGRRSDLLMGMLWRTVDQFLEGDPHAERSLGRLLDRLEAQPHLAIAFVARAMTVMLATRAGRLDRAEALAAECERLGSECGDADATGWLHGQLVAIRWFQGRIGELLPALGSQVHSSALTTLDDSLVAALAVAASAAGDELAAAAALARLGRGDLRRVPPSSTWTITVFGAAVAASRLGDTETAATAYTLLRPFAGLPAMGSLAITCLGSVDHALGVAALATGRVDDAVRHLQHAVRHDLALGHYPAHCLARQQLGLALEARGGRDDRAAAAAATATARREADRLGMVLPAAPSGSAVRPATSRAWAVPASRALPPAAASPSDPPGPSAPAPPEAAGTAQVPVRIRLLGPVHVRSGSRWVPVTGRRRRTVLAALAVNPGEPMDRDQLIDVVWGEAAPRTALNTLQRHVSSLRQLLGAPGSVLARSGGYLLDLDGGTTDVVAVEGLLRRATRSTDPHEVAARLEEALGHWRGTALRDVGGSAWMDGQAQRLAHLLLDLHRALAAARLQLGHHARLVEELEPLVREHPLQEELHADLMLALYRSGQQGRALTVYEGLRSALREELGVHPTRRLRELHLAILRQDEHLDGLRAATAT